MNLVTGIFRPMGSVYIILIILLSGLEALWILYNVGTGLHVNHPGILNTRLNYQGMLNTIKSNYSHNLICFLFWSFGGQTHRWYH